MFVQVKAKFIPKANHFEFVTQLAEPLASSPKFLKASKQDKAEQRKNKTPGPMKVSKPKLTRPVKSAQ